MRKLGYALLAGVFLLMLSALVVSSEEPAPVSSAPLPVKLHFLTAPPSASLPDVPAPQEEQKRSVSAPRYDQTVQQPPEQDRALDSNGRVLTAVRYENSVYQVFRPEVAGG